MPDEIDDAKAAENLADKGVEGGHADVEKFPHSVMGESADRRSTTGDPTMGADADEMAKSDVFTDTDDEAHKKAQERAAEAKEEPQ